MTIYNETLNDEDAELDDIAEANRRAAQEESFATREDATDVGNANALRRLTEGNLLYVHEPKLWMSWDDLRWHPDRSGAKAQRAAIDVSRHIQEAMIHAEQRAADPKFEAQKERYQTLAKSLRASVKKARSKQSIVNMLAIASKFEGIEISVAELDTNRDLLGVTNGVVDLRKGLICEVSRDALVTKHAAVAFDPAAKAPKWCAFVDHVLGFPLPVQYDDHGAIIPESVGRYTPRPDLALFVQKVVGYCLSGWTVEHVLFFMVGHGSNGKSVFWDIIKYMMGDYAAVVSSELLMLASKKDANPEAATPMKATLAGTRLAMSSEIKGDHRLDEATVKSMTGDETTTARFNYGASFEFTITHKHVLLTNDVPVLNHLDEAIKPRILCVPWDCRWNRPNGERNPLLPDGDKDLMQKLREEAPGILAWAVEGARLYFEEGLNPPSCVTDMTREYMAAQDPLGKWLDTLERVGDVKDGWNAGQLFTAFEAWMAAQKIDSLNRPKGTPTVDKTLGKALRARGFNPVNTKKGSVYPLRPRVSPASGEPGGADA